MLSIDKILGIISFTADLMPFLLLCLYFSLLNQKIFAALFCWSIFSLAFDFFVAISINSHEQQLLAFYSILAEVLFVSILCMLMVKQKKVLIATILVTLIFVSMCIYQFRCNGFTTFPDWIAASASVTTLLFCTFIFYDLFVHSKNEFLLNNPTIYIVFGYIIYAAGNLFLFATTEQFPNIFVEPGLWVIFIIANVFKNIFFCKAIFDARKLLKKS